MGIFPLIMHTVLFSVFLFFIEAAIQLTGLRQKYKATINSLEIQSNQFKWPFTIADQV